LQRSSGSGEFAIPRDFTVRRKRQAENSRPAPQSRGTPFAYLDAETIMKRAWLLLWLTVSMACAAKANLATAVQVEQITTGWADTGMVDGKQKIVPTATFTLKNVSNDNLGLVQVNAVFRQVNDPKEWSSHFVPTADSELAAGASTGPITVKGEKGYTSDDPPAAILSNSNFVDAKVELFVRSGSSGWTKLGDYPIDRKLVVPATTSRLS
jgi:hypothetical protein